MGKIFLQKLRIAASDADDLLTSCDASDLLDGLEVARDFMFEAANEIEQLESRLAQAERERDAAISELANSCYACRFILDASHCEGCFQRDGKYPWSPMVRTKFEWRGVCPENTKEE